MTARGFTLLEVLVALAIFGLILAALADGTQLGLRVQDAQARLRDAKGDLDTVDRLLRRLIAGADPQAPVRGAAGTLDLVSRLPDGSGVLTGEAEIGLGVDADHRLVLRWSPHVPGQAAAVAGSMRQAVLLEHVGRLHLSYWGQPEERWVKAWSREAPPELIRLGIEFPAGDRRHWPDIVAAAMRQSPPPPPRNAVAGR